MCNYCDYLQFFLEHSHHKEIGLERLIRIRIATSFGVLNILKCTWLACSRLTPVPRQVELESLQGRRGRDAQWGTAAGPNCVAAQEARRAVGGAPAPEGPQHTGAVPGRHWSLGRWRRAASREGCREIDVTYNLKVGALVWGDLNTLVGQSPAAPDCAPPPPGAERKPLQDRRRRWRRASRSPGWRCIGTFLFQLLPLWSPTLKLAMETLQGRLAAQIILLVMEHGRDEYKAFMRPRQIFFPKLSAVDFLVFFGTF